MKIHDVFGKGVHLLVFFAVIGSVLVGCDDDETYADQKKRERKAVNAFVNRDPLVLLDASGDTLLNTPRINVISEEQFEAQDSMTDVSKNEYVLFANTGIYMQIVRKGAGEKLKSGETTVLLARYYEYNIFGDSLMTTNLTPYWSASPDKINVSNNSGTIVGSFDIDSDLIGSMYSAYRQTVVPDGWLLPLRYVNVGRQTTEDKEIAKVRLIVPHGSGTQIATSNVYPCFYEITFQRTYAD